jgi:hypothetical protein
VHPVSEEANTQQEPPWAVHHSDASAEMDDQGITHGGKFNMVSMRHFSESPLREDANPREQRPRRALEARVSTWDVNFPYAGESRLGDGGARTRITGSALSTAVSSSVSENDEGSQ